MHFAVGGVVTANGLPTSKVRFTRYVTGQCPSGSLLIKACLPHTEVAYIKAL
jgi:hypothetical protein